jgi:sRNA-binding carbon storage regulator CsrA
MIVLEFTRGESFRIGDDIVLTVLDIAKTGAVFCIDASVDVSVETKESREEEILKFYDMLQSESQDLLYDMLVNNMTVQDVTEATVSKGDSNHKALCLLRDFIQEHGTLDNEIWL